MKIKCEYCGSYIHDYDEKCKNCGATNNNIKRSNDGVPKTIEALKNWFNTVSLSPEEKQKFSIGKNLSILNSTGIYKDESTGKVIIYKVDNAKNKEVTYEGDDEEYAVNIVYNEIRDVIMKHKDDKSRMFNTVARVSDSIFRIHQISSIIFLVIFIMVFIGIMSGCAAFFLIR